LNAANPFSERCGGKDVENHNQCPFADCKAMVLKHDKAISDGIVTRKAVTRFLIVMLPILIAALIFWKDQSATSDVVKRNTTIIQENIARDDKQDISIARIESKLESFDKSLQESTRQILNAIERKGVVGY
jgi:hypothetical protein